MSKFQILQSQFLTSLWLHLCIGSRNPDNINVTNYIIVVEDNGSHFHRFLLRDFLDRYENSTHSSPLPIVQGSQGRCSPNLVRMRMNPGPSAHGNAGCNSRMRHRTCESRNTKLENSHLKTPTRINFKQWLILALQAVFLSLLSLVRKHKV